MRTPDRTWQVTCECYQREGEFRIRKVHILLQPLGQGGLRHWIGDSTGEDRGESTKKKQQCAQNSSKGVKHEECSGTINVVLLDKSTKYT